MDDKELLRKILYLREWNQTQLAENLGVHPSAVSKVMNKRTNLRPATRKLAERLLEDAEAEIATV